MHEATQNIDQASHLRAMALNHNSFGPAKKPYVWTVTSGKGGVGKSVIALNVAHIMAEQGRKVLLVDADENLGKLDVLCSSFPAFRISDVLSGKVSVQESVLAIAENVLLLAASSGAIIHNEMSNGDRQYLIERIVHSSLGVTDIIFDTGAGVNGAVLQYASAADDVIVVSHHEPTAVMDAYAVIKLIIAHRTTISSPPSFRLIMNSSNSPTESDEAAAKLRTAVEHFLRITIDVLGSIPADDHVSCSVRDQRPLMKLYPSSAFGLSLRAICNRIELSRSIVQPLSNQMVLA